jgi:hypothetical protein
VTALEGFINSVPKDILQDSKKYVLSPTVERLGVERVQHLVAGTLEAKCPNGEDN